MKIQRNVDKDSHKEDVFVHALGTPPIGTPPIIQINTFPGMDEHQTLATTHMKRMPSCMSLDCPMCLQRQTYCQGCTNSRVSKYSHKEDAFLHVFGQAHSSGFPVQVLAIVDDRDVETQRSQIPLRIQVQV